MLPLAAAAVGAEVALSMMVLGSEEGEEKEGI